MDMDIGHEVGVAVCSRRIVVVGSTGMYVLGFQPSGI